MKKPLIYPVFLPQQGCPFRCVYCNQHAVTGVPERGPSDVVTQGVKAVADYGRRALETGRPGEIAFYGGTFTALDRESLRALLREAESWTDRGAFTGIRFSTRPDALERDVLDLLAEYPVRTVEIGAQSLDDGVLEASGRGYDAARVTAACRAVREWGWRLGLQLMVGLPGETKDRWRRSVLRAVELRPNFVRLYPTLVLSGTILARWFRDGRYRPLELEEAVERCAWAADRLDAASIPIARMGLHPDPALDAPGVVLSGPRHPALGHLVRSRQWRRRVDAHLERAFHDPALAQWDDGSPEPAGLQAEKTKQKDLHSEQALGHKRYFHGVRLLKLSVTIPSRKIGEGIGPSRSNVKYWKERWGFVDVSIHSGATFSVVLGKFHGC